MRGRYLAAAIIALAPSIPRPSGACLGAFPPRPWIASPIAGDTSPPANVAIEAVVDRGEDGGGCKSHCPVLGYIILEPTAIDDHTPSERIGYRFRVLEGEVPASLWPELDETYTVERYGVMYFRIDRDTPAFEFQLEVVAIDESGNESAPVKVRVDGLPHVRIW